MTTTKSNKLHPCSKHTPRFCKKLMIALLNTLGENSAHLIVSFLDINCFLDEEECKKNVAMRLDFVLGETATHIIMNIGWNYRMEKWI